MQTSYRIILRNYNACKLSTNFCGEAFHIFKSSWKARKYCKILVLTSEEAMYTGQFIFIHGPVCFSSQVRFDGKKIWANMIFNERLILL